MLRTHGKSLLGLHVDLTFFKKMWWQILVIFRIVNVAIWQPLLELVCIILLVKSQNLAFHTTEFVVYSYYHLLGKGLFSGISDRNVGESCSLSQGLQQPVIIPYPFCLWHFFNTLDKEKLHDHFLILIVWSSLYS